MQHAGTIRTLVVHEDPIVAAGLVAVLQTQPGIAVTTAPTVAAWLQARVEADDDVDVVVADYQGGLDALAAVKLEPRRPGRAAPKVLVVTQIAREWEVRSAVNAGVHGYVLQSCGVDEILAGVLMVGASRRYLCEAVTERIAESLTRLTLTAREGEVLELLQQGLCNKTIARDLGIAPGTVKAHVKGILEKLDATTRTQAVAVATHRGLIKAGGARPAALVAPTRHVDLSASPAMAAEQRVEFA